MTTPKPGDRVRVTFDTSFEAEVTEVQEGRHHRYVMGPGGRRYFLEDDILTDLNATVTVIRPAIPEGTPLVIAEKVNVVRR